MSMYLIFVVFWLCLGALLMLGQMKNPDGRLYYIPGTTISLAWMALILAFYNLARWYSLWSAEKRRILAQLSKPTPRPDPEQFGTLPLSDIHKEREQLSRETGIEPKKPPT
jgi:hypothetical protein